MIKEVMISSMMQEKLLKLFKEIELDDNLLTYFKNASIEKIIVYDQSKQLDFIINTEEILPIDVYNNVLYKLISYFSTIELVRLFINPKTIDNNLIESYFLNILKTICLDRAKYNIFLEREIKIVDNKFGG